MKKLALLIFIALLSNEVIYAQTNSLYILGTPNICPANYKGLHDGFTVTHIEREKTPEELLREGKLKYREYCKKVLVDGILSREDRLWLEEQRNLLDLSADVADKILKEVKNNLHRPITMTIAQRIQLDNLKKAIENNILGVKSIANTLSLTKFRSSAVLSEAVKSSPGSSPLDKRISFHTLKIL